ncbi:MAG: hypothetical protein DDT29_01233 [Dehalococcoidia bacterium]|nr:hypothetical protein [Bacillota bacterium]
MPTPIITAGALAGGVVGYIVGKGRQRRPIYVCEGEECAPVLPESHNHFNKRSISLETRLSASEWQVAGNTIIVEHITGQLNVRFDTLDSDSIALHEIRRIVFEVPFWRLFFDAPAQLGASAILIIGIGVEVHGHFADVLPTSITLRTNKDLHFTEAIAQNMTEREIVSGLIADKIRIISLAIQSRERLRYRLILFSGRGFTNTNLNLDTFRSEQEFDLPVWGLRIGEIGQFYMSIDGLSIEYEDKERTRTLYVALQNLSIARKSVGAAGEVVLEFTYAPRR